MESNLDYKNKNPKFIIITKKEEKRIEKCKNKIIDEGYYPFHEKL